MQKRQHGKPGIYAAGESENQIEALSSKLLARTREQIRNMGSFEILSQPWVEMAKNIYKLGRIATSESKFASKKVDQTLWEGEENVLRFIVEDGKLNLCLRNMVEFKAHQREKKSVNKRDTDGKGSHILVKFEGGLGTILRFTWEHSEAVQTTDLLLLIQHISDVTTFALTHQEVCDRMPIWIFFFPFYIVGC